MTSFFEILLVLSKYNVSFGDILWNTTLSILDFPLLFNSKLLYDIFQKKKKKKKNKKKNKKQKKKKNKTKIKKKKKR